MMIDNILNQDIVNISKIWLKKIIFYDLKHIK